MFLEEAKWLQGTIRKEGFQKFFPMLNIGSSTEEFRIKRQPWIDRYLFEPARKALLAVVHQDLKDATGVDLAGDILDPHFQNILAQLEVRSIICSNVLEHVERRQEFCKTIASLVPLDGYLLITCPYRYPYHPDPIDTMYRPNLNNIQEAFPNFLLINGAIVECGYYVGRNSSKKTIVAIKRIFRLLLPFYKIHEWLEEVHRMPWLFCKISATCALLKKRLP